MDFSIMLYCSLAFLSPSALPSPAQIKKVVEILRTRGLGHLLQHSTYANDRELNPSNLYNVVT